MAADQWAVFCQHGPRECQLNEVHACALAELEFAEAFEFINCMISGPRSGEKSETNCVFILLRSIFESRDNYCSKNQRNSSAHI